MLLALAYPLALCTLANAAPLQKPNILFILADDLGAHDVGCFGSTFHETPNIDRLAARGVKFTQAYAANPLCSPTRASILTGQHPARTGLTSADCHQVRVNLEKKLLANPTAQMKAVPADSLTRLKPEYFTLAEALREAGYATAHFGKWHLGFNLKPGDHYESKDQGFDFDFPNEPWVGAPNGGYLAPWTFIRDPKITGQPGEHLEDRMSAQAAEYILAHKDKPFFVNYCAYSVHAPWNARRDYVDYFKPKADPGNPQHNALYAAMVRSLDDGVGRLLKAVDDAGLADNTIIIFFSDNGGWAYRPPTTDPEGFTGMPATSNLPLRAGKASLYEGGTRVPCIVTWPGKAAPGTANDALFQSTDFYPTLLAMCGLQPQAGVKLDGFDQTGTLLGLSPPRDRVFCHFPHGTPALANQIPGYLPGTYVREGDWKLIRFYPGTGGGDRFELYNLKQDAGESNNLAAARPDLVARLNTSISDFLNDTAAVVPAPNPNFDHLLGWKAFNCTGAVKDGIATVTGTGLVPYLATGALTNGPSVVTFRARCAAAGTGRIEWLNYLGPNGDPKLVFDYQNPLSVPFTLTAGDWQEITANIPSNGPQGMLRLFLPAQQQPVEIDRVELRNPINTMRWEF